jgi:NADPH:quinone reductase-like Zn-dependent oxidoreductase
MKCVRFHHYGEPADVLEVEECPVPEPGQEEARVRILATPANPSDLLFVRGLYAGVQPQFPARAVRDGILQTAPGRRYSLDEIGTAVAQAESAGSHGKVLLTPG